MKRKRGICRSLVGRGAAKVLHHMPQPVCGPQEIPCGAAIIRALRRSVRRQVLRPPQAFSIECRTGRQPSGRKEVASPSYGNWHQLKSCDFEGIKPEMRYPNCADRIVIIIAFLEKGSTVHVHPH